MRFENMVQGNQFEVGTSQLDRKSVMKPIIEANKEAMTIRIKGIEITLDANWSLSLKTVNWFGYISEADYMKIHGNHFGLKKDSEKYQPTFMITMNGRCTIGGGGSYRYDLPNNQNVEII